MSGGRPVGYSHRPRQIRGVTAYYRDARNKGLAKVAKDRKTGYKIEKIVARAPRPCAKGKKCIDEFGIIGPTTAYARISDGTTRPMGGGGVQRHIPVTADYHFECVPEGAKYLVRFFR